MTGREEGEEGRKEGKEDGADESNEMEEMMMKPREEDKRKEDTEGALILLLFLT